MQIGALLSDDANSFALLEGFEPDQIQKMWREFTDFWAAVPGNRGLKLDWLATWRNRVRDVKERKGTANGNRKHSTDPLERQPGESLGDLGRRLADEARKLERAAGVKRADDPFGVD